MGNLVVLPQLTFSHHLYNLPVRVVAGVVCAMIFVLGIGRTMKPDYSHRYHPVTLPSRIWYWPGSSGSADTRRMQLFPPGEPLTFTYLRDYAVHRSSQAQEWFTAHNLTSEALQRMILYDGSVYAGLVLIGEALAAMAIVKLIRLFWSFYRRRKMQAQQEALESEDGVGTEESDVDQANLQPQHLGDQVVYGEESGEFDDQAAAGDQPKHIAGSGDYCGPFHPSQDPYLMQQARQIASEIRNRESAGGTQRMQTRMGSDHRPNDSNMVCAHQFPFRVNKDSPPGTSYENSTMHGAPRERSLVRQTAGKEMNMEIFQGPSTSKVIHRSNCTNAPCHGCDGVLSDHKHAPHYEGDSDGSQEASRQHRRLTKAIKFVMEHTGNPESRVPLEELRKYSDIINAYLKEGDISRKFCSSCTNKMATLGRELSQQTLPTGNDAIGIGGSRGGDGDLSDIPSSRASAMSAQSFNRRQRRVSDRLFTSTQAIKEDLSTRLMELAGKQKQWANPVDALKLGTTGDETVTNASYLCGQDRSEGVRAAPQAQPQPRPQSRQRGGGAPAASRMFGESAVPLHNQDVGDVEAMVTVSNKTGPTKKQEARMDKLVDSLDETSLSDSLIAREEYSIRVMENPPPRVDQVRGAQAVKAQVHPPPLSKPKAVVEKRAVTPTGGPNGPKEPRAKSSVSRGSVGSNPSIQGARRPKSGPAPDRRPPESQPKRQPPHQPLSPVHEEIAAPRNRRLSFGLRQRIPLEQTPLGGTPGATEIPVKHMQSRRASGVSQASISRLPVAVSEKRQLKQPVRKRPAGNN